METRRRHQVEAAERRMRAQEARGIKDPERLKIQLSKKEELERRQEEAERKHVGERGGGLRWQVD
jgi:small VCP/p97-interacting protein